MKKINYLPVLLSGVPLTAMAGTTAQQETKKPNVVVIVADDLGTNELGCYGGTNLRTPNIDKLAAEGIRMTNNYASCAMSVPIRASMYTGLYPVRHGSFKNHKGTFAGTKSVTHYLSELGYRVGRTGKDHPVNQPVIYAFEKIDGFTVGCTASKPKPATTGGIKQFMSRDDDQPFCLFVCSIHSHMPWDAGDASKFKASEINLPPNIVDNAKTRQEFCKYLAEIQVLDDEVGKVMKALEETGRLDNTLVIFLGEQGPQLPFGKWTCYRYGQNSAFIARYPGKIQPGTTSDALVQYEDILPTLIEFAQGEPVEGLDGFSCLDVLFGRKAEHREWAYGIHNNLPEGTPYPIRSIQDKKYKLIWNLTPEAEYYEKHMMNPDKTGSIWNSWIESARTDANARFLTERFVKRPEIELYDMENDPWELTNIADMPEHARRITEMKAELQRWMDQQGDRGIPMDSDNPDDPSFKPAQAVSTFDEFDAIRNDLTGNYYLENDIEIPEGVEWVPIGASGSNDGNPQNFIGRLDGKGHAVRNIKISNGGNFTGFIGRLANGGQVANLRLENVEIKGGTPTGGLAATMFGGVKIEQVSVTGSVTGGGETGGISGRSNNAEKNRITNCYVNASVSGTGTATVYVGGMIGLINGKAVEITNSYVAGSIKAASAGRTDNYAGGLIGAINNNVADAQVKATGTVVVADEITGGTPNLFIGTELNKTKLVCENTYVRNDITLTYADENHKGTGAAMVTPSMERNHEDFMDEDFYMNTLSWDFELVWKMGRKYPIFIDQEDESGIGATFFPGKENCNLFTIKNGIRLIPLENLSFGVYDLMGKQVYGRQNINSQVDIFLNPGVFLVRTSCDSGDNAVKVVVK